MRRGKQPHRPDRRGRAATWPRIEMIRNCTLISRTLDKILEVLEQQHIFAQE